jgi:hypothetical protein
MCADESSTALMGSLILTNLFQRNNMVLYWPDVMIFS